MTTEWVECYSGTTYAERPTALHWQGRRLAVAAVEARWRTPDGRAFRLRTVDDRVFEVVYNEARDQWHIRPACLSHSEGA